MLRYLSFFARRIRHNVRRYLPSIPSWLVALRSRPKSWYACFAPGMRRISTLSLLAGGEVVFLPASWLTSLLVFLIGGSIEGVLVWGCKEKWRRASWDELADAALRRGGRYGALGAYLEASRGFFAQRRLVQARHFAMRFARTRHLPIIRVEDGFLRSLDLGVRGAVPLSLTVDRTGMYYDATRPSDLENLLNSDWECPDPGEAEEALRLIRSLDLSKYNHADPIEPLPPVPKRVLVLDQTKGDVSISLGMATEETFTLMLRDAVAEHKGAEILLKVHPDVLSGKKEGHFDLGQCPANVRVLARDVSPLSLLEEVDEVYTVTSQMGFEALFLGKRVHCYGIPFYAGWGLTQDHLHCSRRKRTRTLTEVFSAAYLVYAKYVDPMCGELTTLPAVARTLLLERDINRENAGVHACLYFSAWKYEHARAFLSGTRSKIAFFYAEEAALSFAKEHGGDLVVWASRERPDLEESCRREGVRLVRMEDGFIRSVGLGSDFHAPGSLVLDDLGIYYDPTRESRLERILHEDRTPEELRLAEALREELVRAGISKYNISGKNELSALPADKRVILVPGQVEDDASVRRGGLGIAENAMLLATVRERNPEAFILYKEHPDVVSGNRIGALPGEAEHFADLIIRTTPIEQVLPLCAEVHTLTSLTGFEALLRGIPVTTYGGPFYAGWGLTNDLHTFVRRRKRLTLAHLVYGTLVRYPRYYDWNNRMFVPCETFVRCLAKQRAKG